MRLIDADKLVPDAEWNAWESEFTCYSREQIENAPTVKAIPLETEEGSIVAVLCPKCGHVIWTDTTDKSSVFKAIQETETDCAWK